MDLVWQLLSEITAVLLMDNIGLQFIIGVIVMIATPIIGFLSMIKIRAIGDFYENMGK